MPRPWPPPRLQRPAPAPALASAAPSLAQAAGGGHADLPTATPILLQGGPQYRPSAPFSDLPPTPAVAAPLTATTIGPGPTGGTYTLDELAAATGLSAGRRSASWSGFGLLSSRDVGGDVYYDEDAATIAALAAGFARHGIGARHLRMYKNAAERESDLFEQIVMPLVKQRNPQARQQAAITLEDLGRLSGELRRALLRQALGNAF